MEKRIWPPDDAVQGSPASPEDVALPADASLHDKVIAAIRKVFDPEIPVNIYDLGLVYKIDANPQTGRCMCR
ncbi:MAG: DUF59 domain-containing protein [Phycisphaerales bacterium]|nr:DUF59 domain-containing protein [Phycisphaerales bacterium]